MAGLRPGLGRGGMTHSFDVMDILAMSAAGEAGPMAAATAVLSVGRGAVKRRRGAGRPAALAEVFVSGCCWAEGSGARNLNGGAGTAVADPAAADFGLRLGALADGILAGSLAALQTLAASWVGGEGARGVGVDDIGDGELGAFAREARKACRRAWVCGCSMVIR